VLPSIIANPLAEFYRYGAEVKLTAVPPTGTYFSSWVGAVSGTNNPAWLVVTNPNPSVSYLLGVLSPGQHSLAVAEQGGGYVNQLPQANTHNDGAVVALAAIPFAGQDFIGWGGDASGTNNPLLVPMNQSKVITANFTKRPTLRAVTPLDGLVEDGFRLTVLGESGATHQLFGSTNLSDWTPVGIVTNTWGTVQFTDSAATNRRAFFYRSLAGE
jgi:hypothetical protein